MATNVHLAEESTKSNTLRSSSIEFGFTSRGNNLDKTRHDLMNENIISLIAETNRTVRNSNILRDITTIWVLQQLIFGSFLMCLPEALGPSWLKMWSKGIFLFSYDNSEGVIQLIQIIIQGITAFFSMTIIIDFTLNHKYRKWELYILRFWHCHIYNIFIIPNIVTTLDSIPTYGLNPDTRNGAILLANILSTIYCLFHVFRVTVPLEQNPFLIKYDVLYWRPNLLYFSFFVYSFLFGICTFNRLYSNYARFVPQGIFILALPYHIYHFNDFPYGNMITNVVHHTYAFLGVFASGLSIVYNIFEYTNEYFYFFPIIGLTIISGVFVYFHHNLKTRYFRQNLFDQLPDGQIMPENKRKDHLDSLNITLSDAFYYLEVGVEYASPLFLDWTLSNYILEKYSDNCEIIVFLTWLVSFFPSETHILHNFISIGLRMTNPSYYLRCFFYQLHRVHVFRQSSASSESVSDFSKVKSLTKTCVGLISWYWMMEGTDQSQINNDTVHIITNKIIEADTVWAELLEKYPNNHGFSSLYAQYLIDAKSSFRLSAKWHEKSLLIESGAILHNDHLFRGFLQVFPFYLKSQIVDTHGTILRTNKITKQSKNYHTAMSSNSISSSDTDDDSNSLNMEEASNFIPNFKLRFALERPVKELSSSVTEKITIWSIIRFVLNIIFIVLIYTSIIGLFGPIELLSTHVQNLNHFAHPIELLTHEIAWFFISAFPDISNDSSMLPIYQRAFGNTANQMEYFVNVSAPMSETIYNLSRDSLFNLDRFSSVLYERRNQGNDIIMALSDIFSLKKFDNSICMKDMIVEKIDMENSTTFDFLLRSFSTKTIKLANDNTESREMWDEKDQFCESFSQPWPMQLGFANIISYLLQSVPTLYTQDSVSTSSEDIIQSCEFILAIIPFMSLLLVFPNVVFMTYGIEDEKKRFNQMLSTVESEDALEASQRLFKNAPSNESQRISAFHYAQHFINWNLMINVLSILIICAFMMTNTGLADDRQEIVTTLFEHYLLTFLQRNAVFDIGRDTAYLVLVRQLNNTGLRTRFLIEDDIFDEIYENWSLMTALPFSNEEEVLGHLEIDFQLFSNISSAMEKGTSKIPPIIGNNGEIDKFKQATKCDKQSRNSSPLLYAQCISFDRLVAYFITVAKEVLIHYDEMSLNSSNVLQLANLVESRLSSEFDQLLSLYSNIIFNYLTEFDTISISFLVIELVLSVAIFFVEFGLVFSINREMQVFKSLLLRLNPVAVVSNPILISWIFGNKAGLEKKIKTPAHAIFQTSNDAMLFLSSDHIIETVNPASTILFGYTNEQMVGQDIKLLLNQDGNSRLYYVMKMMNSGQSEMTFEDNVIGTRDDSTNIKMKVELISFAGEDKRATNFILLLKDMTEDIVQNEAVEEAKKQSDVIMHQILPKNIINRLNNADEEIAFHVQTATVIIIDIDNFTSYAASLTPADLLSNLSKVFSAFDKIAGSFPLVSKIKVMGDVYMAAGGLFEKDIDPKIHAIQVLQFASNALIAIEELNLTLNANLQIRIGITTDGPFVVGILGRDKPVFDILGAPIAFAFELEKTDPPGQMHLSQKTYELVNSLHYQMEENTSMVYKGEKQKTYFVFQDENADTSKVSSFIDENEAHAPMTLETLNSGQADGPYQFRLSSLLD